MLTRQLHVFRVNLLITPEREKGRSGDYLPIWARDIMGFQALGARSINLPQIK